LAKDLNAAPMYTLIPKFQALLKSDQCTMYVVSRSGSNLGSSYLSTYIRIVSFNTLGVM